MNTYTVIWRVTQDDHTATVVPYDGDPGRMSSNDWIRLAIFHDADDMPFAADESKDDYIADLIRVATDYDDPDFIGYDLIGVLEGAPVWVG